MSTPTAAPAVARIAKARKRGLRSEIGDRRLRRLAHGRKEFFHRAKNGIGDPITFFHIVDALIMDKGEPFHTRDLVVRLVSDSPQLGWDSTTVGRILNDIIESVSEANARTYISTVRHWDGTLYAVEQTPEARAVLFNLLDDLAVLCEELMEQERQGIQPSRLNSPLGRCPSVTVPV
jgi:hypothetical protein